MELTGCCCQKEPEPEPDLVSGLFPHIPMVRINSQFFRTIILVLQIWFLISMQSSPSRVQPLAKTKEVLTETTLQGPRHIMLGLLFLNSCGKVPPSEHCLFNNLYCYFTCNFGGRFY